MAGAEAPAMPLPESTTIFIGRASLMSPTMRVAVGGQHVHHGAREPPSCSTQLSLVIMRVRMAWISSP